MSIRQSTSTHQFWSSISSSDHGAFLEGFELLGSTKAKNMFRLCTSTATDVSIPSLDSSEEPTSLLVSSILKRMGKIAMQMQDTQVSFIPSYKSVVFPVCFSVCGNFFPYPCVDKDRVQLLPYDFISSWF